MTNKKGPVRLRIASVLVPALATLLLAQMPAHAKKESEAAPGNSGAAPGHSGDGGRPSAEALRQVRELAAQCRSAAFDASRQGKKVRVGRKNAAAVEFDADSRREGRKLMLGLRRAKGKAAGDQTDFSYDEAARTINLSSRGEKVTVQISADNRVSVDSIQCDGNDLECIGEAVTRAMPKLESEDMAAIVVALEDDLAGMDNGVQIIASMTQIAGRIGAKAGPPKVKLEGDDEFDKLDPETKKMFLDMREVGKHDNSQADDNGGDE